MERVSSGNRIDAAKDYAAGLAIATRMVAKVRGLNQAVHNANDGISLAQTAEGAMGEISNIVVRMRELAVQSANGSSAASDQSAIDAALVAQIGDMTSRTEFKGTTPIDAARMITILTGAESGETVNIALVAIPKPDCNARTGKPEPAERAQPAALGSASRVAPDEKDIPIAFGASRAIGM